MAGDLSRRYIRVEGNPGEGGTPPITATYHRGRRAVRRRLEQTPRAPAEGPERPRRFTAAVNLAPV